VCGLRNPREDRVARAVGIARTRSADLQALLGDTPQEYKVTLAVGVVENASIIVGTSEPRGYIREWVRPEIREDEEVAKGNAHAEVNVVSHCGGLLLAVGAGRNICENCESSITSVRALPASACRSGRRYV
jgi:hypothetical protein